MELVGTALFLFTIQLSVNLSSEDAGPLAPPVAIGVVLATLVYAGGPISGGHYNPAVTLAVYLRGKLDRTDLPLYWAAQVLGGYGGALLAGLVGGSFAVITIGHGHTATQACLVELVFTFLLCFVVLSVATHSGVADNSYYGAAIGGVVLAGALCVGSISGGAFNPAVALGLCLSKGLANLMYVLMVVVTNLVGGGCAALVFSLVAPDQWEATTGAASIGETTNLV